MLVAFDYGDVLGAVSKYKVHVTAADNGIAYYEGDGGLALKAWDSGVYHLTLSNGTTRTVTVPFASSGAGSARP